MGHLDLRKFLDDLAEDHEIEPPLPKKFRCDTGKKDGQKAQWITDFEELWAREGDGNVFVMPTDSNSAAEYYTKPFYYGVLGAQNRAIVDWVDHRRPIPKVDEGEEEECMDVGIGGHRTCLSIGTTPGLGKKSLFYCRGKKDVLVVPQHFGLQAYDIRDFPHAAMFKKTDLNHLIGEAVTATVLQAVYFATELTLGPPIRVKKCDQGPTHARQDGNACANLQDMPGVALGLSGSTSSSSSSGDTWLAHSKPMQVFEQGSDRPGLTWYGKQRQMYNKEQERLFNLKKQNLMKRKV